MLNLAGREYDFGPVLFAVLQECEHRRRGLPAEPANPADPGEPRQTLATLAELARRQLDEIHASYEEAGGSPGYWHELESEVLDTALPQYARAAAEQTRLELASYGLWRQGDPVSRLVLGLSGLVVGGLIVKAPFIPIVENTFAFALAVAAFFYPEIKRLVYDWRFSRLLNRLIVQAERYQNRRLPYVSEAGLEAELRAVSVPRATTTPAATPRNAAAGALPPTASPRSPLSIFAPSASAAPPEPAPRTEAAAGGASDTKQHGRG